MAESNQHKYLKKIGALKLVRMGCWVTYPEVFAENCGVLDVVGAKRVVKHIQGYEFKSKIETYGIEVKVSRSDYASKKQKYHAIREEKGFTTEEQLGANFRYFLTPVGLIQPFQLYKGWGLLEFDGKRIREIVKAPRNEVNNELTLYYMAKVPMYHYHQQITKLMAGYSWKNYNEVEF